MGTVTLAAVALAVVTIGAGLGCSASEGTAAEALTSDELPAYGMNYGGLAPKDYDTKMLAQHHLGLARTWWGLSPTTNPDPNQWLEWDEQVALAAMGNVSIIPVIFTALGAPYTAADRAQWVTFVQDLVGRYGPKTAAGGGTFWNLHPSLNYMPVRAWEIFNEENHSDFWGGAPSPSDYNNALQAAHQTLRAVDPDARIVLGGLIGFDPSDGSNALEFLSAVTEIGNGKCLFDAVAVHPYSKQQPVAVQHVSEVHDTLHGLGLDDVQISVTEVGWAIGGAWQRGSDGLIEQTPFTVSSAHNLAEHIADFANAMDNHRSAWNIGPTIWFNYQDLPETSPEWDHHAGFMALDSSGSPTIPRPAVWQAATQAATTTPSVTLPKVRCAGQ